MLESGQKVDMSLIHEIPDASVGADLVSVTFTITEENDLKELVIDTAGERARAKRNPVGTTIDR